MPFLGRTIEPTPLSEVWVSQPRICELAKAVPIHLSCGAIGSGDTHPPPSMPEADGIPGPEVKEQDF